MRFAVAFFLMITTLSWSQTSFDEAEMLFTAREYDKAKPLFLFHLKNQPNDLKTVEYLGDIACFEKDWDEAIQYYGKLVEGDEQSADFHYKLGGALGMKSLEVNKFKALGMIDDVEKHFLKAAELDENHIDTRWALVELYMKLPGILGGGTKKALKYAEELQNLSAVDGHLAKGTIHDQNHDFKKAETQYLKAVEVGGSATCYQKLADLYVKYKLNEKAISTLKKAYQIHQKTDFLLQLETLRKKS